MNKPEHNPKSTEKTIEAKELQTDYPLSEKDEVKSAEQKMASLHKKATTTKNK